MKLTSKSITPIDDNKSDNTNSNQVRTTSEAMPVLAPAPGRRCPHQAHAQTHAHPACRRKKTSDACRRSAPSERAHVRAVVEAPEARRLVLRCRHHMLAVASHAHRGHALAVPLKRVHLRAFGERPCSRASSLASWNAVHTPQGL
eukprot:6212496-Pleurochrysis_carterae.AAC.4